MRAKTCIAICLLIQPLIVIDARHAHCGSTTAAETTGRARATETQWKSIPEDPTAWRREPFKTGEAPKSVPAPQGSRITAVASAEFTLQGIMKSNGHYHAIINGRTIKPGDRIDGWSISEISRYRVTMRRDKEKYILDIYQGRIDRGTR